MAFLFAIFLPLFLMNPVEWHAVVGICSVAIVWFVFLRRLRLEIGPDGVRCRGVIFNRTLQFAEISKAYFKTEYGGYAPQGVSFFWLQPSEGKPMKVNLRYFPIDAAALLFTALERRNIAIEVPNTWSAKRMVAQVRKQQNKRLSQ